MTDKNQPFVLGAKTSNDNKYIASQVGKVKNVFPAYQTTSFSTLESTIVQPQTAVSRSSFASGAFIDFILPKTQKRLNEVSVEFNIQNPNDTTAFLPMSYSLIDRVEYYSGQSFITSIDGFTFYLNSKLFQTDREIESMKTFTNSKVGGIAVNFASLGQGQSKTLYVDITSPLQNLVPGFLIEDIKIRIFLNKEENWNIGTALGVELLQLRLMCELVNLSSDEVAHVADKYATGQLTMRYIEPRMTRTRMTLNPSSTYTHMLNNLHGRFLGFLCFTQYSDKTFQNSWNITDEIDLIHISDESNQIMLGGSTLPASFYTYQHARNFASSMLNDTKLIPLLFSQQIYKDFRSGSVSGSTFIKSVGENITFTTKSSVPSNHESEFCVLGYHTSALRIQNGKIVVLR